jgi:membrane-associated HD superfamily phosphohydrolase
LVRERERERRRRRRRRGKRRGERERVTLAIDAIVHNSSVWIDLKQYTQLEATSAYLYTNGIFLLVHIVFNLFIFYFLFYFCRHTLQAAEQKGSGKNTIFISN